MRDTEGRNINYMRISITDRCNLRCRYCMPDGIEKLSKSRIMTYEEILEVVEAAVGIGITRFKITGGEPLVRLGCPELIRQIKSISGVQQVTMTTNGVLLGTYLDELKDAGLDAVNVSLDALDPVLYEQITGFDKYAAVMESIDKAVEAGLKVKINVVLQKDMNAGEWKELALLARERSVDVRFIELMPIGQGHVYRGISGDWLRDMIEKEFSGLEEDTRVHGNGPARYYKLNGFKGSIGFISAIHGKFCDGCNRIRLTSTGFLKPCLCYGEGVDLRRVMSEDRYRDVDNRVDEEARAAAITAAISKAIEMKPKQHCFDSVDKITENLDMIQIGG